MNILTIFDKEPVGNKWNVFKELIIDRQSKGTRIEEYPDLTERQANRKLNELKTKFWSIN